MNKVFVLIFFFDFDTLGFIQERTVVATKKSIFFCEQSLNKSDKISTYRSFSPSENILTFGLEGMVFDMG